MIQGLSNAERDELVRQYARDRESGKHALLHWTCIPALIFGLLGAIFLINFGLSLISIAVAILFYSRFGQKIAVQMGAMLLVMLAAWMLLSMLLMQAHHLAAICLGIFLLALAGQFFGQVPEHIPGPSGSWIRQFLLVGPVLALEMLKDRLPLKDRVAANPGLDP